MICAVPDRGGDSGCHDDIKFSNLGGAISGEQDSDCATGVVDVNNGCFNKPSTLCSNSGNKFRELSVSTYIASDAGSLKMYAICAKGREGSISCGDLQFSNPGGAISGELVTSCTMGEGGLGCGFCSELSIPLFKGTRRGCMACMSTSIASNAGCGPAASSNVTSKGSVAAASGMIFAVSERGGDTGCLDDLIVSNPGSAISGKQGSDCGTGVVDLKNGCFNNPKTLLSNGSSKLCALSVSTCVSSNAGTGKTASSGFCVSALVAIKSNEVYVVSLGGSLDRLKFSNPGGGVSVEQGSACVMGEGGLGSGCCNDPDDGGGRRGAVFIFASLASNTVKELGASSGVAEFSNECAVLTDRLAE
jgi:hypothetical protein